MTAFSLYVVTILLLTTFSVVRSNVDLVFNKKEYMFPVALLQTEDFKTIRDTGITDEFSACFNAILKNPKDQEKIGLFSYSSEEADEYKEVVLELVNENDERSVNLYINGQSKSFGYAPPLGKWFHQCVTWSNNRGTAELYVNGERLSKVTGLKKGHQIGKEGYWSLGQIQNAFFDYFDTTSGLQGRMTDYQVFDRVVSPEEVALVRNCSLGGNKVNWGSAHWGLYGNIQVQKTKGPCKTCD